MQIRNDIVCEFGALDGGGSFHQAREIIRHAFGSDGLAQTGFNPIRRFGPTNIPQHHGPGEDDRAGVNLVLSGVFRRSAVCGLEYGMAGDVVNITARRNADAATWAARRLIYNRRSNSAWR